MKTEKLLLWGGVIAGALIVSKILNVGKAAGEVLTATGSKIGETLYDLFHPSSEGETTFFIVKFPDAQFHSVPASYVDEDGFFVNMNLAPNYAGDGKKYRIVIDKNATPGGRSDKIAVLA
jgi:hypothetical protein